jgi:tetratricopeptide (TPR) repeat protein
MLRGTLALFLALLAGDPSFAQAPAAVSPSSSGQVRCPALTEAPKEVLANPVPYDRLIGYLSLVERYCRDPQQALAEIDRFPWTDFRDSRGYLAHRRDQMLSRAVNKQSLFGGADWFVRVVRTAAMLHLDRAVVEPAGTEAGASHLNWSRELVRLLPGVDPDPTFQRDWYIVVSAYLQGQLRLAELDEHLSEARAAFPDDAQVLLAWGLMREAEASPGGSVVIEVLRLRTSALRLRFPDEESALADAERYFREALERDPGLHEARLRHGRVLGRLERPDEALRELDAVRTAHAEPRQTYLAALFAGAVLGRAGRLPEAVEAYRAAAGLYPRCQTATLALSYAMRKSGARDEALALVRQALDHDSDAECVDPWWLYDFGLGPQGDALLDRLRAEVRR